MPEVTDIYVPPVPHDAGVSTGAAMLKCVELGYKIEPMTHAYYGPEYENKEIHYWLNQVQTSFQEVDNPEELAAADLAAGKIVGWFQGRMEFGPRALGNRSILADPRSKQVKDRINATIKYREEYRPFCPSVIFERQSELFSEEVNAPFMTMNVNGLPVSRDKIPAVVHVDGTARIQSVHKETNPMFHKLIDEFSKESGVPVVVNTSLNINEQPTVNSPIEALHTFFCSGLDALYIGNFKLEKRK
jgi:carbamoyltransferase